MATVTSFTAARMLAIENSSIIDGYIRGADGHLILIQKDLTEIDAGPVAGTNVMGVEDSASLNLSIEGQGTSDAPWSISGEVIFPDPPPASVLVTDWNLATTPGIYHSTNATNSPTPGVNWFTGRVYVYEPTGRIIQEVRRFATSGHQNLFVRYWDSTKWTAWVISGVGRGTTAERDALFPAPANDTERVALANRKILWYNTDLGWQESYYAVTGLTGLTAKGLIAGTDSDWYPTGTGPECILEPTTSFGVTSGNYVGNWHNGNMRRKGGADWFVPLSNGFLEVKKAGIYDLRVWTVITTGTGQANFQFRVMDTTLTTQIRNVEGLLPILTSTWAMQTAGELTGTYLRPTEKIGLYCHSGSLTVHFLDRSPRAQMIARYVGPPLVSD